MKRFLIIGLLVAFFLGSVSAATTCSSDDERLFRIDDEKNAHGELWNGVNNYAEQICFDNYFNGTWASDGHACDGNNLVLNFSDTTNAHAEKPGGVNFNVGVCFGDLICELRDDLCEGFTSGGRNSSFIVSLDAETDAHMALSTRAGYGKNLCCVSLTTDPICNYNNDCEDDRGENEINCPRDCPPACNNDGELDIGAGEQCDCGGGECTSEQLNNQNCSSFLGPNWEGKLGCTNECTFKTRNRCFERGGPGGDFCADNWANFDYPGNGTNGCNVGDFCRVESCNDVNKMTSSLDFKQDTCEQCISPAPDEILGGTGFCTWDSAANTCYASFITGGGTECRTEWVSENTCGPGDTTREVVIRYTRISGPPDPECQEGEQTKTVPCARVVQLPFFGVWGVILSVIIIALIYYIYLKKKK